MFTVWNGFKQGDFLLYWFSTFFFFAFHFWCLTLALILSADRTLNILIFWIQFNSPFLWGATSYWSWTLAYILCWIWERVELYICCTDMP